MLRWQSDNEIHFTLNVLMSPVHKLVQPSHYIGLGYRESELIPQLLRTGTKFLSLFFPSSKLSSFLLCSVMHSIPQHVGIYIQVVGSRYPHCKLKVQADARLAPCHKPCLGTSYDRCHRSLSDRRPWLVRNVRVETRPAISDSPVPTPIEKRLSSNVTIL